MRATLDCTSCWAAMTSTSSCSRTRTMELPSMEVEVTSSIPWTVFSASSMGRDTSRSTTSGEAPG